MNAARGPVSFDIGEQVIFVVQELRSNGVWAYLEAVPHQPDGRPLDWNRTKLAAQWRADMMSDIIMVLLHKTNGRWQVVDHIVGPTDVYWFGWVDQYGLPESLFFSR